MEPKTVLFSSLNESGHINALIGLADRLKQDHGYRTVFLLIGQTTVRTIEEHGHELLIIDQNTLELEGGKNKYVQHNPWNNVVDRMRDMIRMDYEDMVPKLMGSPYSFGYLSKVEWTKNHSTFAKAIESIKPDLIILDTWIVPPCVIANKHIPWVYVCSANPFTFLWSKLGFRVPRWIGTRLYSKTERERIRREEPARWTAMLDNWKELSEKVYVKSFQNREFDQLYLDAGVQPIEQGHLGHHSPYLNLYMYPKELDYNQEDDLFEYPPRWFRCDHFIRRSERQVHEEFWSKKLDEAMLGKTEMIYFSLGTLASGNLELMRHYLDILKEDKKRLYVVSKGSKGDQIELAENMIGANYLPQTFFLEKANLGIIHGGNNSFIECLYYGKPMIVLPCFGDQPDNGQRVEDLKLGRWFVIHKCNKEELMGAIEDLLGDKELAERVQRIGNQMRARDEPQQVSLMLKELLETKQLNKKYMDDSRVEHRS